LECNVDGFWEGFVAEFVGENLGAATDVPQIEFHTVVCEQCIRVAFGEPVYEFAEEFVFVAVLNAGAPEDPHFDVAVGSEAVSNPDRDELEVP
jgi:hypothetical protein